MLIQGKHISIKECLWSYFCLISVLFLADFLQSNYYWYLLDCFPQCTKQLCPSCFLRSFLILTWAWAVSDQLCSPSLCCRCYSSCSPAWATAPCSGWPLVTPLHGMKVSLEKRETFISYKTSNGTEWSVIDVTLCIICFFCFSIGD